MKYIDAEKLAKAIEDKGLDCSFALKMERLDTLALIDELQQEQPEVDLEKELKDGRTKLLDAFGPMNGEQSLAVKNFARHFYELGKKSKEPVIEDLEVREQIEELANDWHHKGFASDEDCPLCMQDLMDILWHFYELGIKTKKGK